MLRRLALALAMLAACPAASSACCIRVHLLPHGWHRANGWPPLAIGDSVMIAAAHRLARSGFEVDAREGRFMRSAIRVLKTRRRRDRRPDVVVLGIGTNFPPTYPEIARALRLLGPGRRLVLVTPERSWRPLPSPAMWEAQRRHPRRVQVLDWASLSVRHPSWFWGDGTHLRAAGAHAYARLLRRALP
jgi:hypothetical protein